jgi:hypothetical protein
MALASATEVYAVNKCVITPITADPPGGTTTYSSTKYYVPGIKSVEITPQADVKELIGDNQTLHRRSQVNSCEVKITFAKFDFSVFPIISGGTTANTGTTPNQVSTWSWNFQQGTDFKLEASVAGVDPVAGDLHVVLYKVNVTTPPPLSLVEQDFSTFEATGNAYKRLSDGKAIDFILNETAVALTTA